MRFGPARMMMLPMRPPHFDQNRRRGFGGIRIGGLGDGGRVDSRRFAGDERIDDGGRFNRRGRRLDRRGRGCDIVRRFGRLRRDCRVAFLMLRRKKAQRDGAPPAALSPVSGGASAVGIPSVAVEAASTGCRDNGSVAAFGSNGAVIGGPERRSMT